MKQLLVALLVLGFTGLNGQPKDLEKRKEKIDALRVAFITTEVSISPEEAAAFWPIYNELSEKMFTLEMEDRKSRKKAMKNKETLSDKELENVIQAHFRRELQRAQLKKEYHERLKLVLPIQKLALVYDAEFEFRRELMKELKNREGKKGDGNRRPPRGE